MARRVTLVDSLRRVNEHALFVDPGDFLSPVRSARDTLTAALVRDGIDAIHYDALGVGRQEINRLSVNPDVLDGLPIVSSNVFIERDGDMVPVGATYVIREFGPMRVGVFALTEPDSAALAFGVDIRDPKPATQDVLDEFDRWKVDVVVLLSTLERTRALSLLVEFPDVDIVVFGHPSTALYPDGPKLRGFAALSLVSGGLGVNLAHGRIVLNGSHHISDRIADLIQVESTIVPDPTLAARIRSVDDILGIEDD